jgi:hypothetical protein
MTFGGKTWLNGEAGEDHKGWDPAFTNGHSLQEAHRATGSGALERWVRRAAGQRFDQRTPACTYRLARIADSPRGSCAAQCQWP